MKKYLLTILIIMAFAFAGCNASPKINIPQPTVVTSESEAPIATSQPTPTPKPTTEELSTILFDSDVTNFIPTGFFVNEDNLPNYDLITSKKEKVFSLPIKYEEWLNSAMTNLPSDVKVNIEGIPNQQMLSLLAYNYKDNKEYLKSALQSAINLDYNGDVFNISPKHHMEVLFSTPETEEYKHINGVFMYAYLTTIFDEELNFIEDTPEEKYTVEDFLFPIDPVKNYYFENNWYDARDSGKRRHTGTDINAPEGTALLSCVDGTILDTGANSGAGNYVVVLGADSTQYHYYHMVEPSNTTVGQKVKIGEQIGKVGNTGNSTANHLHFTIISPDGQYLNPYPYLERAYDNLQQTSF